ncbi:MAG: hypothetical protein M3Y87_03155 [Myxococcota bacterium]|nr:hypothetical protein [Myxococcota bacterium]
MPGWDRIVCVDWAKGEHNRAAWVAHVGTRTVVPLEVRPRLTELLAYARGVPGRTVIAIDAALGVPRHYLADAQVAVPEWRAAGTFLAWLSLAIPRPGFGEACAAAADWRHGRPFIAVPRGTGSLEAFWAWTGGKLLRDIDKATRAKSPFIVSGIPGTVGSGTRALWCELAPLLKDTRDFAVWPFDGAWDDIGRDIALAEIYPRVCYSLALSAELPSVLMPLDKGSRDVRDRAVDDLQRMDWVRDDGVTLRELDRARASEDDFDAMISAAALLRCVIEGRPVDGGERDDVEGGILGLASVHVTPPGNPPPRRPPRKNVPSRAPTELRCPIDSCPKIFKRTRGGWDRHVELLAIHPWWHPAERDPVRRKALFRAEFPSWFR